MCAFDCAYCASRCSTMFRALFFGRAIGRPHHGVLPAQLHRGPVSFEWGFEEPRLRRGIIECLRILREEYGFRGYIHAKAVPGTSSDLLAAPAFADRISMNMELPSSESLALCARINARFHRCAHAPNSRGHRRRSRYAGAYAARCVLYGAAASCPKNARIRAGGASTQRSSAQPRNRFSNTEPLLVAL